MIWEMTVYASVQAFSISGVQEWPEKCRSAAIRLVPTAG